MPGGSLADVLRYLRRQAPGGETNCALLERFAVARDPAAFEALLARHGPMVWGVCRGLLGETHAAEDAFQATFLVLVRKAGAVARGERLANWLYGVARRVALRARAVADRQQPRDDLEPAAPPAEDAAAREAARVIHEELDRLPDRYRTPVVLCCLEGKTCEQAAQELGWTRDSVRGRLERARARLRDRLTRRGLALSAGLLAEALTKPAHAVPPSLMSATVRAALLVAAEGAAALAALPVGVATLTKGVIHAMLLTKMKTAAAAVLALTVLTAGAGKLVWQRGAAAQAPAEGKAKAAQDDAAKLREQLREQAFKEWLSGQGRFGGEPPIADLSAEKLRTLLAGLKNGKVNALLKQQYEAAHTEADARWKGFMHGRETLDMILGASFRLLQAELDLVSGADRIAVFEAYWQRAKDLETLNKIRFDAGRIAVTDYAQSQFARARAEIWLERTKAGQPVKLFGSVKD